MENKAIQKDLNHRFLLNLSFSYNLRWCVSDLRYWTVVEAVCEAVYEAVYEAYNLLDF